jgi:hypothetical protein
MVRYDHVVTQPVMPPPVAHGGPLVSDCQSVTESHQVDAHHAWSAVTLYIMCRAALQQAESRVEAFEGLKASTL